MKSSLKLLFVFLTITFTFHCSFAQGWQWKKTLGGPCREGAEMVMDLNGNIYIAGYFSSSNPIQCGPSYVKIESDTLFSIGDNDIFLAKYDSSGNYLWSKQFGGNNPPGAGEGTKLIFDSASNSIYLYGGIYGTVTIGTYTMVCQQYDLFLARFDLNGNCNWAKNIGSAFNEIPTNIDVLNDKIYLSGILPDSAYVGTYYLPPGDFLASFDLNGNNIWAKNIGDINGVPGNFTTDFSLRFLKAKENTIFIFGKGTDTLTIDGITLIGEPNSENILLCKFDLNGDIISAKLDGGPYMVSKTIAADLDSEFNIYIAATFVDSAAIGDTLIIDPGHDIIIAKYDSSFNLAWVKQLFSTGYSSTLVNNFWIEENTFYITGEFQQTANFGIQTLSTSTTNGNMFLAKYDQNGNCLGVDRAFSDAENSGRAIALYNNYVYLLGTYFQDVILGNDTFNSLGWDDIFIAKHAPIIVSTQNRLANNNSNQLLIYANPNTGKCNITVPDEFSKEENLTLRIFDNNGKLIQEQTVEMYEDKVKVNLEAEAKGVYNVTLSNNPSAGSGRRKKNYAGKIVFE